MRIVLAWTSYLGYATASRAFVILSNEGMQSLCVRFRPPPAAASLRLLARPRGHTDANCAVIRSVNSPSRSTTSKMYRSQSLERPEMSTRM